MEYKSIIEIIENKRRFGNLPGVEISREVLAAVGNPQRDLCFVHIAGTNGKGSTAAFLCSILKEAGICTGMFTSPHLVSFTERIQVDGVQIKEDDVQRIGKMLLSLELGVQPTMFDYCLAMALIYFKEQKCRLVVLETGLGGRLDATNVIESPLVTVITKIGYDHVETLGNTLTKIAFEKAGIIKEGTVVISESQEPEAESVIRQVCKEKCVSLRQIEEESTAYVKGGFSFLGEVFQMSMAGNHQWENGAAAILAARELMQKGYAVTREDIHRGIAKGFWPGRMEIVSKRPFLMIDGAHNGHGVQALAKSLSCSYPGEKMHFIMGVMADKDYEDMISDILPLAIDVVTVTLESGRALEGERLAEAIRKKGIPARHCGSVRSALKPFTETVGEGLNMEKTIAFGSLYFIGDIRKILRLRA